METPGVDWGTLLWVLGLILVQVVGLVRWVSAKTDVLHTRINDVRETYVRRDDFDKHLERIEKQLDKMIDAQEKYAQHMALRMDGLMNYLHSMKERRDDKDYSGR